MSKLPLQSATLTAFLVLASVTPLLAQDQPSPKPTATPIKVTVTISRYQAEKRISNLPYVLSVNLQPGNIERANLRMGSKVPVFATSPAPKGGVEQPPSITYQDTGTNIDCTAWNADEAGRFRLQISIDESSVYADDEQSKFAAANGRPTFRSFRTMDSVMLKDGQTVQMSNTPDRTTGETVRVEVALAVVK